MMTIDEAIQHCEEQATKLCNTNCGHEHEQLAHWLKELKELKKETTTTQEDIVRILILPKIQESEDEIIKKEIISYIKSSGAISNKKWIAWLEKQGKNNMGISEATKQKLDDNLHEALEKETPESCNEFLEKQCEQKPINDMVEPIFNVGEWVVNTITNNVEQIIEVTSNDYICSGPLIVSFDNQHLLRKWTIRDAKDGDVLTTDTWTFIFKKYQDKSVYHHCAVSTFNNFSISDTGEFDSNYVHPATKEQRDLLFQKMKEAGYELDVKKKELKKIDLKSNWSEEDEQIFNVMKSELEKYIKLYQYGTPLSVNDIEWFKSLKDRVQHSK